MLVDLTSLSEQELLDLSSEVYKELTLRLAIRVKNGDFPALAEEERALVYNQEKVQAIRDYRQRTGIGLREAKAVVDSFQEYMEVNCE